ncbi:hypothetical protein JOM56_015482 [Amanita muscaria]
MLLGGQRVRARFSSFIITSLLTFRCSLSAGSSWTTPLGDASNQLWYIMQGDTMSQPIVFATFPLPVLAQKHPNQRKMLKISRIGLHGSSDCFKLSCPIVLWIARRRNSQMKQQSSFFLPSVPTLKVLTNRSI